MATKRQHTTIEAAGHEVRLSNPGQRPRSRGRPGRMSDRGRIRSPIPHSRTTGRAGRSVQSFGPLSSRQRRTLAPWRMRPALTWSKETSTTSSGRSSIHSRSRSAAQRLGSAEPRSPVSYGASLATSSRFSLALKPEVWPTTRSLPPLVQAQDQRADGALLLARPPADDDAVQRFARASPSPSPCARRAGRGRRAAWRSRPRPTRARARPWRGCSRAASARSSRRRSSFARPGRRPATRARSRRSANGRFRSFFLRPSASRSKARNSAGVSLGEHPHPRLRRVQAVLERVEHLAARQRRGSPARRRARSGPRGNTSSGK